MKIKLYLNIYLRNLILFHHNYSTILFELNTKNTKTLPQNERSNVSEASPYNIVKEDINKVNKFIIRKLQSDVPLIPIISEHLLKSGGKRIRPTLTILFSKLFGYHFGSRHIELAACVELIHMASILHDDVVDESKLRRGKTTANNLWGNKSSILVGDYLFSKSFQIMTRDDDSAVMKTIADASQLLAKGEVMQLSLTNNLDTTKEKYFRVIEGKTSGLFSAASLLGGIITTQKQEILRKLNLFGKYLGIAFQILDDVLDYDVTSNNFGKKFGDDFKEGKVTLPVLIAYDKSNNKEKVFWKKVIEDLNQDQEDFKKALDIIFKYNSLDEAKSYSEAYASQANEILNTLPKNKYSDSLAEICKFVFKRRN
ncbi:MAG: Octaprenyl-diphosphate synthase [Alphaproteobacteria bacterium MarineAlpha9_Bin4]|nr:farnesyltranstransferase [Pelagibacterales bacterium]PPR26501.1 MAG: Octaprenyl-diphosphate synthase [Alphaproteobacteria bacterium MarineAlpha9_Bin4]